MVGEPLKARSLSSSPRIISRASDTPASPSYAESPVDGAAYEDGPGAEREGPERVEA